MLASERTRTGLPLTSGLVKYSPFQAAPAAGAGAGAGVRVGAGTGVGLVGSGVSVGGTGLGDGIWVGVADGAAVAVGAAVGNAVGELARVAVAATVVNVAVGCGEGAGGGVSVAGAGWLRHAWDCGWRGLGRSSTTCQEQSDCYGNDDIARHGASPFWSAVWLDSHPLAGRPPSEG